MVAAVSTLRKRPWYLIQPMLLLLLLTPRSRCRGGRCSALLLVLPRRLLLALLLCTQLLLLRPLGLLLGREAGGQRDQALNLTGLQKVAVPVYRNNTVTSSCVLVCVEGGGWRER